MPIVSRVRAFIREHALLAPGDSVVVAVSGGPDSVTLLHVLHRLSEELSLRLHVFHMDHGLRGEDSAADAAYARMLAERLGLPCTVVALPPGYLKQQSGSLQANARAVRYEEIARLARRVGAGVVAVGQNQNDQAETVLMRFLRGAGPRGLGGIAPVRRQEGLTYIRPLLAIPRKDIENYCQVHELNPREDASNQRQDYLRNRLRLELLPHLAEAYNPAIAETLSRTADVLREEDALLSELAAAAMNRCRAGGEGVGLVGHVLLAEPRALARRVVRMAAEEAAQRVVDLGPEAVDKVLRLAARNEGSHALDLPEGLRVVAEYGICRFHASTRDLPEQLVHRLLVPGDTPIPALGITVTVTTQCDIADSASTITLDPDLLPGPLAVRRRSPGDRIYPVGMSGSKKLQDIFVDAKVPRRLRDEIPVLVSGDEVVWAIGYRVDRRFLAAPGAKSTLSVQVHPAASKPGD